MMLGESPPSDNLTPEMNCPFSQFLSESLNLTPSFKVNDFLELPLELLLDGEALVRVVPSKLAQYARMLIFLNELTELDCELALDSEAEALLPLGPLLWLELEFFDDDDDDWLDVCSTSLKIRPDKTWPFGHKLSP